MNEAPNTQKQNVTRTPFRESVRALATTAAAPHVCCVLCCMCVCCVVLLSPLWLLLYFWCGGVRASKYTGVPLSVSGYPATLFYPKTRPIPAGLRSCPNPAGCWTGFLVFDWRVPTLQHTAHTLNTAPPPPPGHRTSHITHHTQHTRMDICFTSSSASGGSWKQRR